MSDNEYLLVLSRTDKDLFEAVANYRISTKDLVERYKRQKAEIERYKGVIKILENDVHTAKLESRKEFADRLKKECVLISDPTDRATMLITIDALLKEMEGIDNGR